MLSFKEIGRALKRQGVDGVALVGNATGMRRQDEFRSSRYIDKDIEKEEGRGYLVLPEIRTLGRYAGS